MTAALSSYELTAMRAAIEDLLPDTCIILTATNTPDGGGNVDITWGTTTTSVKCRIDPIRAIEQMGGAAIQPYTRFQLTVPYDTALTSSQRVKIGTISYNIIGLQASNSWALDLRAVVEKV